VQRASRDAAVLLAGVEEVEGKKRVLAGVTLEAMSAMHNRSPDQPDQHVLPSAQENRCRSNEVREN